MENTLIYNGLGSSISLCLRGHEREQDRCTRMQWWHFDYSGDGGGYYDYPITPR
jgi:hypothetical protein